MENIFTEEYLKNLGDIEITQLPDKLNPDKLLYNEIEQKYTKTCPYCNKAVGLRPLLCQNEYRHDGKWWQFWKPIHYSKRIHVKCDYCGTEWYTPWFPQDLTKKELKKYKKGIKHEKISNV